MRKISIIAFLASFFIAFQSHALSSEEIMKRTAANVNGAPSMTFRFTATTGDGARTTGTLTMCRSRFVMQTAVQSVWYDGRSLWSYAPSAGETNLSEPLPEELLEINPFDILNQHASLYSIKKLSPVGKDERIELTARKKSMAVRRAVLVVNHATMLPTAIDVTFSNSARMSIVISSAQKGKALPASAFTYPKAKYPKVKVIDLR